MEKELMTNIKNELTEMQYNGADIKDIKMFENIEGNIVISYKFNDKKYVISIEEVD